MLRFTDAQQAQVVANRRAFNLRQEALTVNGMVGNALPIPFNTWGEWDRESVAIQRDVLSVFNDLSASVSRPIHIGKLVHHFQTVTDSGSTNKSLDGRSKADTDQPVFEFHGTPLPIIDSGFSYGWRQIAAAESDGFSELDSAARENSMRRVAEDLELQALDGDAKIVVGGSQLYGIRTAPNRNTRSTGVTLNGATGAQWVAEVNAVTALLYNDNFFVEPTLYVNVNDWKYARETDYSNNYPNKTIAQRVMESGIENVVPASKVSANEMIAVVKRASVVQVLNGMPMVTRARFRANDEDDYEFTTMAAASVEVKFDADQRCGIAHSS